MFVKLKKQLLLIAGTICVVIGVIGIFVPILPTTPFLLLAAACYIRSSKKFYNWLLHNRFFGAYIRNYIEGRGMPAKVKIFTIILLWVAIVISICVAAPNLIVKTVLIIIAIGVTLHIVFIKARKRSWLWGDRWVIVEASGCMLICNKSIYSAYPLVVEL